MCLAFFDMTSMGVCTTRPWQTSGRPVQELNICTVEGKPQYHDPINLENTYTWHRKVVSEGIVTQKN